MVETKTTRPADFYKHLTQRVAEGRLLIDEAGMIMSANRAAAAILGCEPEALVGQEARAFWMEATPHTGQTEAAYERVEVRQGNGRTVPVRLTISPLATSDAGRSALVTMTSLEDMHQLNEALSYTQRLAGIGLLTASVVHELNTPISIITATCSNLLHGVEDDSLDSEQLAHYAQMIEQSAWRAARILEVLRHYSYRDEPQFAVTDLNLIIEDALTLVRHQFRGELGIEIQTDLASQLKSIVCDHNRVTQVLLNLLHNAGDAMRPGGGRLLIRSWTLSASAMPNGANGQKRPLRAPEYHAFSVQDSGQGIDPAIMPRIFDPFFTTKPSGQGTGLGLYIARRVVEQHNGRIWAENNPQGGATFTVILPTQQ